MYETWGWINALEGEADRKLLYGWACMKARKGAKLKHFALENTMDDRFLKKIDDLNQKIANNLNRLYLVRFTDGVDPVSENDDTHINKRYRPRNAPITGEHRTPSPGTSLLFMRK